MTSKKLQPVRGTHDLLPDEARKFQHIVDTARKVGELYGFQPFHTPIFEFTEVFSRTLGETSDVVNKEMYTFTDKGGESITLRPEFTAGIARAFISNGLQQRLPLKLFSHGPLFRYERPQKGRQRQFHQINFEWLGGADYVSDVEVISLAARILETLGIKDKVSLHINTLGDAESRACYTEKLVAYLRAHQGELSEDSKLRLEKNPLRILDSKDAGDKEIVKGAPTLKEELNDVSRARYEAVLGALKTLLNGWDIVENPNLVRGLDYYSHTVFEFVSHSDETGAQNTVLAGGRYDGLMTQMGGPETPAIGFAAGVERLMLLADEARMPKQPPAIVFLPFDEEGMNATLCFAEGIRNFLAGLNKHLPIEIITSPSNLGKKLAKADKLGALYAVMVFLGEMKIKNLRTGEEKSYPPTEIAAQALKDLVEETLKSYY